MTQTQDEVAFGLVNYLPAVMLARTGVDTAAPTRHGGDLEFVMYRCGGDHGVVWHQVTDARVVRRGKVCLRMELPGARQPCVVLVDQAMLLDVRPEAGLSAQDQVKAAHEMLGVAHPDTRFDIRCDYSGGAGSHGIAVRWQDGPSTEAVSSLFRQDCFTRAHLRRSISAEHACMLQLLIWAWHDEQPIMPTQEEFTDVYDALFVRGVDEFSAELRELNRSLGEQARAASVHPHTWVREHGAAVLLESGVDWRGYCVVAASTVGRPPR